MAEKPSLYIDHQAGKIEGPMEIIGRLFATPKDKSWGYAPPISTIVISNPQRFQRTVERLRQLGYPLVERPAPTLPPQG